MLPDASIQDVMDIVGFSEKNRSNTNVEFSVYHKASNAAINVTSLNSSHTNSPELNSKEYENSESDKTRQHSFGQSVFAYSNLANIKQRRSSMWSNKNGNYKRSTQKFSCSYCDKVFTRHGGLVGHLRVHTGERPHQCQMCGKRFSDSSSLTKHIRTHTGEKPFLCNICHRAFSISHNLTRHLKLHAKECQNVGSKVQSPDSCNISSSKAKRSYICSKCSAVCQSFTELNSHMQKMHAKRHPKLSTKLSTKIRIEKTNSLANSSNTVISDLSSLSCIPKSQDTETASFTNIQSLEPKTVCLQEKPKMTIELSAEDPHLPIKENLFHLMPNNDNLQFLTYSVFDKGDINQNKLATSSLVKNNSLDQRQSLLLKATQEKESSEFFPTTVSPSSNSTTSHLNTIDPLLHDPLVNIVPESYTNLVPIQQNQETSVLHSQFKSIHPNNKTAWTLKTDNNGKIRQHKKKISSLQFQSRQECSKEIPSLRDKTSHNIVSRENGPKYQCQRRTLRILPESKTLSTNIDKQTIHNHSFHGQNLSDPTPGQDNNSTLSPRILQTKSQSEKIRNKSARLGDKKYPCLYCDKVFTRPGGLVGHTRVHTGEKPHKCQTCGKRFSDSSSLTKHIRTHTGEKPFKCNLCHRAFSISHNLTRHLKLHSRDKLHSREGNHFTKSAKAAIRIHSNSRPLEKRISKFRSSSTLRKPSLGQISSEMLATSVYTFDVIKDIHRFPALVNSGKLTKEESVLPENDIKPNLSSLQIKEVSSFNGDEEHVLTWCPSEDDNHFNRSNENFEQANSISPLVVSSGYDPVKKFEEQPEPNETLKNGSILNSLDITFSANSNSSVVTSKNSDSIIESEPKIEPSWFDVCVSAEDEGIGSEKSSLLSNKQCEQYASSTQKDVNIDDCKSLYTEYNVKKDGLMHSFQQNKQQISQNRTKPAKISQMYQCGYCLEQFSDMNILSEHIQVHNKKPQLTQKTGGNQIDCSQNDSNFSESFPQTAVLKKTIDFTLEDKDIQKYSKSGENKTASNSDVLAAKPQNTFHTEMQQTKTTNSKLSSYVSVKTSKTPTKNLNFSPLQNSQTQILQTKSLVNEAKSKFRCSYCNKVFSRHSGLVGHLRVHTGEKPHECQTCNKRFSDSSSLTKHIRIHTGEKPFICTICYRAFSISHNLTRHLKLHSREKQQNVKTNKTGNFFKSGKRGARTIRCRYCCATFQCLRVLKNHLRYHSLTSKTFKTSRKNSVGNGKRINDGINSAGEKREILINIDKTIPELPFQENISANHFNRKKQLPSVSRIHNKILKSRYHSLGMINSGNFGRKHIDKGTNLKTFVKDTLSSTPTSSTGMRFESAGEMKTNEMVSGSLGATKELSDVSTLSQNNAVVSSTELSPKTTEQLKNGFLAFTKNEEGTKLVAQSPEIKQINTVSESRILLKSCLTNNEENWTTNSDLSVPSQEDLKDLLMERKPVFSADINETDKYQNDSKKFCPNYSRNTSREIESKPKASKCGYCHKSFRDFSSLSKHMTVHKEQQSRFQNASRINSDVISLLHSRSLSKRFKMTRLGLEQTKSRIGLNKKDVRIYSCPFCAKQFTRHGGLVGHLRVHTGEKPHECQTCSKRFSDSSSLTKHIRTHTGEKPFRCKFCHRAFSISHNLTRHLKLHSRENQKSNTQTQHIKRKSEKCNQETNVSQRFSKNKVPSFGVLSKSDGSRSASVNFKSDYCKKASSELQDIRQSYCDKSSVPDCQIQNLTSTVSNPTLASDHKFIEHQQQNINPENISSHQRVFSQSVTVITTDHLSVIPTLNHSLSNNLSSNQLLDDQEISLKFKPQFVSSSPEELNITNKTSLSMGNAPWSDNVGQILQPVTNKHLPPVSKETPSFSSNGKIKTAQLVSSHTNAVKSCNKQSSPISSSKESESQSKTFSDTFSKTFLLLDSLSSYNSSEINNIQPKTNPQTLHTENLQPVPNSYAETQSTRILSPSALSVESSMKKNTSNSFFSPMESLRISSCKEDDSFSVETVLSEVTESLTREKDCSISVDDEKVFNSLYTFQNGQTFNDIAKTHIQSNNQKTFADNTSSFPDPQQKTPIPKNTCILCRTYFPNFKQLEAHLKIHRSQNKTFTCGYCGRNFARFSGLMGHARTHTLERPYVCSVCQRAFSDSSSLTKHTRTHTGEKPFTCKYCSRAFSISHNLTRHLKLHSREKNKPP